MKKITLLATCISLVGCGTITLGHVQPQASKTQDQQQSDTLYCKDQATLAANSPGMQAGGFLLGMTIIGVPVAYAMEVSTKRQVFSDCMGSKGYAVIPPDDGPNSNPSNTYSPPATNIQQVSNPIAEKLLGVPAPAGFDKRQPNTEKGWQFYAINKTTDSGVLVSASSLAGIADLKTYANSKKSGQQSSLTESTSGDLLAVVVSGHKGFSYEVTGTHKNIRFTYLVYLLDVNGTVLQVTTWTSAANFPSQKSNLSTLPQYFVSNVF